MIEPLNTQTSYDAVAAEYAARFFHELAHKPFDRKMLDWLIEKVAGSGAICDLGCGPGQIARYLRDHGAEACGIDLSPEMVAQAQQLNPDLSFYQGDMLALTAVPDDYYGGVAAFYSLIHVPAGLVVDALKEIKRVLRSEGVLLLTFHIGSQVVHLDDWWEQKVNLDFNFFETQAIKGHLAEAGFTPEEVIERDPYPEIEVQTRRAYIFARKRA
ncbi:MAG: class I SAM-dependent methyltransferase [Chloroflexi bacterium]|jgi:SAM-dependent methyltransferase|nr:class I SAM-dependent methyltransferase [Chloroflexota bacterium]MDL1882663.1 class I SAM-dependent methyltransferase [Anaerolineae bacterium CFX8]GIL12966.1 MAG: methyltransferase [Chloroflexota bacterium]